MVAPYLASSSVDPASVASAALQFRLPPGSTCRSGRTASARRRTRNCSSGIDRAIPPSSTTRRCRRSWAPALWADIELFNHGSPLFLDTGNGLSGAYRSASVQRINQQLWSARSAGKRVAWLNQYHMSEVVGPGQGYGEAPHDEHLSRVVLAGCLVPVDPVQTTYHYSVAPATSYPTAAAMSCSTAG
jgi:hypothetical protein